MNAATTTSCLRFGPAIAGAAIALACGNVGAQPEPPVPAEAPRAAIDNPDVYVNDSFEAADAMTKAQAFVNRGRWSEAAQILQRAIHGADHRLLHTASGAYTGIRRHIADIIARWPLEGIAEYRRLFESDLDRALKALPNERSLDDLLVLFERYFCTAGAARLADVIGQLAIETADLALAQNVYERVVKSHPDAAAWNVRYRAMLNILAAMQGQPADAGPADGDDVRIRWMGQDRPLAQVLESVRAGFDGFRTATASDHWPIFAGNTQRNRPAACHVDEPGLLWRVDLLEEGRSHAPEPPEIDEDRNVTARELTVFPVMDADLVYVQWKRQVIALRRATGAVVWRYGPVGPRESNFDYLEDSPPGWNSVTAYEGRVYASLPGDDSPYHTYDSPRVVSELVCLDGQTGELIWTINQKPADDPLADISFDSSPVVKGRSMYVIGRRRRAFGFEDCYLYRLSTHDGAVEYRTHLGSASTGTFGTRPATRAVVALDGDTLYVCTNLGTVAAVSAHLGEILWLRLYERIRPDSAQAVHRAARDVSPWQFMPVIVADNKVICIPADSLNVLVLSAESGDPVRLIAQETLSEVETVFGIHNGLMCGVGREAFCYDLREGGVRWTSPLPAGGLLFGRGTWADDELLIPRRNGLSRFKVADGSRFDVSWGAEGQGGNLTAMPGMLLVAGPGEVAAYVRKADIWTALREKMAAAAQDPVPALELAEVALNIGEYEEALRVLDEAVHRTEQLSQPVDAGLADRLLNDALRFAASAAQRTAQPLVTLDRLHAIAGQFARNAEANLRYRFAFAELYERLQQPERAVRMYQQILRDRSLREAPWTGAARGSPARSGAQAQSRIARLLDAHGRAIYAMHESDARQWLASGAASGDADTLQRVVDTFPNSQAAPQALIALGELAARAGRVDLAARQFARAYHRYPKDVDRPALLRKIADTYEHAGMIEHAYRWLDKARREYPRATVEHDGRSLTMAQYLERLSGVRQRVEPSRPTIRLSIGKRFERTLDSNARLLVPVFRDDPSANWSRFFVHDAGGIAAFDSRTGDPLWKQPAAVVGNPDLLVARDGEAVFATPHEVIALDPKSGARRWSHGQPPAGDADPGRDWEESAVFRAHDLRGNRLASVRDDGTMLGIDLGVGRVAWSQIVEPTPGGRVRLGDEWVAYHGVQDGQAVVGLIDASTGAPLSSFLLEEARPIEDLFVTLDGQVLVVTSQAISSYDPDSRQRRWSTPVAAAPRAGAMLLEVDAFYFCGDEGELRKLDLDDGKPAWPPTERLIERGETNVTLQREGVEIILSSSGSVCAVDSVDGLVLWRGTTPDHCRLAARAVTDAYVVAVDIGDAPTPRAFAYFYDHRNHSGLIPADGAVDLGEISDFRAALALHGALVLQTGSVIRGFAQP